MLVYIILQEKGLCCRGVSNTVTRSMPDPAPVGTLLVAAGRFRLASHRSTPSNRANSRLFQDMRSCGARNDLGG